MTQFANAVTTSERNTLQSSIASTMSQLAVANGSLANANVHAYVQGVGIDTLQTCLGGVKGAFDQITAKNNAQAAKDITTVSGACTQTGRRHRHRPGLPLRLSRPFGDPRGQTFYAYATNSVAGNIQIIASADLTHWTAIGNALPNLPAWATPDYTWAPAVATIGGSFSCTTRSTSRVPARSASRWPRPAGPRALSPTVDGAARMPEVARRIDRPGVVHRHQRHALPGLEVRRPGLVQDLVAAAGPVGHVVRRRDDPTALLAPDQSWEAGTVEAPDMVVTTGGHYYLFFSGNDWDSADYAVGVATCTGPSGPCSDATPGPILASGQGVAGPGGESVFADAAGNFWITFHAWVPGAVGFPNGRDLYIRPLTFSDTGVARRRVRAGQRVAAAPPPAGRAPAHPARAHNAANSSVGPLQRNWSTSPSSERSIRNVASSLKRRASSRPSRKVAASLAAPDDDLPVGGVRRDLLDVPPAGQHVAADFAPQPARPGKPSALSPTSAR